MSCPHCAHCAGDLTGPEAVELGRRVPGLAIPHDAQLVALLTDPALFADVLAWYRRGQNGARLTVKLVRRENEIVARVQEPPPRPRVYRRLRRKRKAA